MSCEELTHWKRPWCWGGLGAGGEGDDRGWDGWMASPTWWTWVWVNSGSWWWTGRPGVLGFMGSQRVGHDWATELNWKSIYRQDHKHWRSYERFGRQTSDKPDLTTLGKLFHQMLCASILGAIYCQVTRWCAGPLRVWCFLSMCHTNPRVCCLEFHGTRVGWQYLIGVSPVKFKRILLKVSFPVYEISRLQGCLRSSSPESALWKHCSSKTWLFLIEAIRPSQHRNISHFISCRLNSARAKCIECPVTLSKGESLNSTRDGYKI